MYKKWLKAIFESAWCNVFTPNRRSCLDYDRLLQMKVSYWESKLKADILYDDKIKKSICNQTLKLISAKALRLWCTTREKEPKFRWFFSEEKEKSIVLKQAEQLDDYSASCTFCTASRTPWSEFEEDAWICADVEETCCNWICDPTWAWESCSPRHPPAAYSPSTRSRANLKTLGCLLGLQRGLRVVLRTVKDLNKDHISRLASALQSLFNNQCEKVWSDSCFTDVAGMCFA